MTMQKLTAADPETKSPDLAAENLAALRALFPELVTEGANGVAVNLDVLKQLVGDKIVTDAEEKYGLNWHGKRRARQIALTPSTGTLRPCTEESVDWDTTHNIMIEGDNLEVLKLLQKSYAGKVKLIYIDPPYNTGKDFVYPDNFQDSIENYLELTGQTGEGGKRRYSNTEASGRFHTDWLSMMYPRLKLARNLLRSDGVIFISIDDGEQSNLQAMLTDIFGEENFAAWFVIKSNPRGSQSTSMSASVHEYVACFAKSADRLSSLAIPLDERMSSEYDKQDDRGKYRLLGLRQRGGFWRKADRPLLHYPLYIAEQDGSVSIEPSDCHRIKVLPVQPTTGEDGTWRWGKDKAGKESAKLIGRTVTRDDLTVWDVFQKDYLNCADGTEKLTKPKTIWDEKELNYQNGTTEVKELFLGKEVFDFPKPVALLNRITTLGTVFDDADIVLDFFAGSGTTGHSVMAKNASDMGNRQFILVQLPEPLDPENGNQKAAADYCDHLGKPRTIAELTKERLRRAGKRIREENPLFAGDLGFRVFKLAGSNIRAWEPDRENLAETLEASIEHLKTDRTEQDILFELLLKLGLDLCVPIERKKVAGGMKRAHEIHSIGSGSLLVCLSPAIPQADVEPLALGLIAWHKALKPAGETIVVFRDSAFADDVAKTNLTAILQQNGLDVVRSL
jgi:adenine-specific DNA-methyltransferase